MLVLGIETSCDDTSLALYSRESGLLAQYTSSQLVHEKYGGVVPELASRAHMKTILPVFKEVLSRGGIRENEIEGIGVSNGPGLIGSLLVGVAFAKALALGLGVPLAGVHHIEAHIMANALGGGELQFPAVVLVVSGGHTVLYRMDDIGRYLLLGSTRDDAAGEAFDKIAKLLGLGYPGGPAIERAARKGRSDAVCFPRAMMNSGDHDFSFSGLKTAVRLHVEGTGKLDEKKVADIAASAQAAIIEPLVGKTMACAGASGAKHVYLAGGVAANEALRKALREACGERGLEFHAPQVEYCTDNGAMVACAAEKRLSLEREDGIDLDVFARGSIESWR
jgi:N6-L-threonylcarbamoyladenine synthase